LAIAETGKVKLVDVEVQNIEVIRQLAHRSSISM